MKVLQIVAKREGFRRAGFAFGSTPVELALDDLTKDQLVALRSEPNLVVIESEVADKKAVKGGDK